MPKKETTPTEDAQEETKQVIVSDEANATEEAVPEKTDVELAAEAIEAETKIPVDDLKTKYGKIQVLPVADEVYIYRQMTKAEHIKLVADKVFNKEDSSVLIAKQFVVYPDVSEYDWAGEAGTPNTLSEYIMLFSGFGPQAEPITL